MMTFVSVTDQIANCVPGICLWMERKYNHITPLLQQLHWLPVSYHVVFKILLLVYKVCHGLCPGYVTELLQERKSFWVLCASSLGFPATPTSRKKTYGKRAFPVCALKLRNGLLNHVRNVGTLSLCKNNLKPHLFSIFYWQSLCSF